MEVDVDQLPIPDWDVHCPRCGYPLRGLTVHRCPECGQPFAMADVLRTWTRVRPPRFTGRERPLPDFGLTCAACKAPLVGATDDSCPKCRTPFDLRALVPRKTWFLVDEGFAAPLDLPTLATVLEQEQVPLAPVSGRTTTDLIMGTRAIGARLLVPGEFYFEALWIARDRRKRLESIRAAALTEWACKSCQEMNPGHFELCWNCETTRESS